MRVVSNPVNSYKERRVRFTREAEAFHKRSSLLSNLRGLSFGVMVILGIAGYASNPLLYQAGVPLALLVFIGCVVAHNQVIKKQEEALRWAKVNADAVARNDGTWTELPGSGARFKADDPDHGFADDLDLFGPGSLFQRISVAHTRYGRNALARFLRQPVAPGTTLERQEAVRALEPELETRQHLEALALALVDAPTVLGADDERRKKKPPPAEAPDPEPLLEWAESAPWVLERPQLVWGSRILPAITVAMLIAWGFFGVTYLAWLAPVLVQVVLLMTLKGRASAVFAALSSTQGAFLRYGPMLELFENLKLDSKLLNRLQEELLSGERKPSVSMREFQRALGWFELKHNGLIHPLANFFLMWDVHCLIGLERWQQRSGKAVRQWFTALGELEALSSFAGYAHDEPHHCWPELTSETRFVAKELGHPLIGDGQRVTNDVSLPEAARALLVTGSNMSGKSTLLRSMGLAVVMAQAGAPVCARELALSPLTLRTSIRIRDDLGGGVSHFYAEVRKLKHVVTASQREGPPVFFLLDEVLHGTNSRERQIGARWVLRELLARGALGAISTHDLGLCQLAPAQMERVELVHFQEGVAGDGTADQAAGTGANRMIFDYRLRSGPVRSGNALKLMNQVGLPVPLEGDPELELDTPPG